MSPQPMPDPEDHLATAGNEPLVPILRADDGQIDPVTLSTWHTALSNTLAVEVPHDLLGLWLYPAPGGTTLLGPAELAQDALVVPVPSPNLKPEQLSAVEEKVLSAGYGSASCLPIRFGQRDVGLMLVADLQAQRYGEREQSLLHCVTRRVAPMLGRIARHWRPADGSSLLQQERIAGLLETVAGANRDAGSPQRFVLALSRGLLPLLPHDHIELLVPDGTGDRYFRLGEHPGGALWADPSLVISREHLDIEAIFGTRNRVLVPDLYDDERWPRGFLTASHSGVDIRSVIGARMTLREKSAAFFLVGSAGPELYEAEDMELLVLLAGLITPQVGDFARADSAPAVSVRTAERDPYAELLFRIAGLLATTSDPSVATQLIAAEAKGMLPFTKLVFALRLTESRVAQLEPGERRSLRQLPLVPVSGTPLAKVLQGDLPCAFDYEEAETRMIVPLRVAGRVQGALIFTAEAGGLSEVHVLPAQHLADIVAAHLELLRRVALLPSPSTPASRRTEQR